MSAQLRNSGLSKEPAAAISGATLRRAGRGDRRTRPRLQPSAAAAENGNSMETSSPGFTFRAVMVP